ncbi:MAG TPA: hypothetical protein VGC79_09875 [Polyangiaceae bacterium]
MSISCRRLGSAMSLAMLFSSVLTSNARAAPPRAAPPTTSECLEASEAAIQSGDQHRLRAQRQQLLVCSAASCPAEIRRECLRRVDEVNASIPTIIFEVRDATGRDQTAVKVSFDGQLLAERLDGTALAIDPGEHTFSFELAGQPPLEKRILIREAQKDRQETITFAPAPEPLAAQPAQVTPEPPPPPPPPTEANREPAPSKSTSASPTRIAGYVVAGAGVVGLGVGTLFHFLAANENKQALETCTGGASGNQCSSLEDLGNHDAFVDSAKSQRTVSYVSLGVGAAALITGVTLVVVGHHSEKRAATLLLPTVGAHDLGLSMSGVF